MQVTVQAPAKLNLTLDVVGVRPDGYHLLESIMQTVDICDTLTAVPAADVTLAVEGADVGPMEKNIAYRAARLFFEQTGVTGGVSMTLTKRIPTQAGMGGGSADGAAALLALDRLYDTHLSTAQLCEMGVRIGADVPFCLVGGTALCTGIGEDIQPLPSLPDCYIVIAQPPEGVSTVAAYAALDSAPLRDRPDHPAALAALTAGDLPGLCRQAANVFEPALALPGVAAIRREMAAFSPLCCRMTGSGSVVYGVFDRAEDAEACARHLKPLFPVVLECRPCGGPQVIV